MAAILKNRYEVITCRWLHMGQYDNRKQNSNMAAIHFPKPEVVLSQPWIHISYRNLACK